MKRTLVALAVVAAGLTPGTRTVDAQPTAGMVMVTGARLVDLGSNPGVSDAVILIKDGRVVRSGSPATVTVPEGARIVDVGGRFVMPGLVSAHVHMSNLAPVEAQLGVYARYGITTVLSLGGEPASAFQARAAQGTPPLGRARLFLAGDIITSATPDAARADVARVAASRPDMIKIRVDDNLGTAQKMAPEVFRAVIEEAHRHGLRVAAHVFYLDDAKALLRAGVDMIAHSVRDRDIDAEFIALMKAGNIPYCPTLTRELSTFVYESTPAFLEDPFFLREADPTVVAGLKEPSRQEAMGKSKSAQAYKAALVVAERNLRTAVNAGLLVVMGTDSGPFPERFQGYFEQVELTMMAAAGLTPAQVLRSATVDAARAMKLPDVGTLAPGAWADFVVLDRNPLENVRNTRSIHSVWIAGGAVPPATRRSPS
ncbi:MAG: amidohydrolase family protein [Acidobacteria bacterium]|nr:amidohydrolase family protein [Acidobacteriota bacterium]